MKKTTILILMTTTTLLLAGCSSIRDFTREHPAVTAFGAAIVVGSIAASVSGDSHSSEPLAIEHGRLPCHPQPDGSCR